MQISRHRWLLALTVLIGRGALAQPANPACAYNDKATNTTPRLKEWLGSAWDTSKIGSTLSAPVTWQQLVSSPTINERTLLSLTNTRVLTRQVFDGTAWGAATVLTSDAGTRNTRVFAAEYGQVSGKLLVVYRKGKGKTVYYRDYGGTGAEQSCPLTLSLAPAYMTLIPKPGSNEMILLVSTASRLYGAVWNGSSFGNTITFETALAKTGRPLACAYESKTGRALVTWGPSSGAPAYRTWNGSAWSAESALPNPGSSVRWMSLSACPTSNDIVLGETTTGKAVVVNRWNGSAWGSNVTVDTAAAASTQHLVEACYQHDGAKAVVLWQKAATTTLSYATWNGASWSSAATGPNIGAVCRVIQAVPGKTGQEVLTTALRKNATPLVTDYTLYSKAGTVTTGSTDVDGEVGAAVVGVVAPTTPTASPGIINLSYGNNATATILPGSYGTLTIGNSSTITLSTGTFAFKSISVGNNSSIMSDTSLADTVIYVTTSGLTAGTGFTLASVDPDDPNDIAVHVIAGNALISNGCTLDTSIFYVYAGTATFGTSADLTTLVYSSGSLSISSGAAVPSNAVTPSGQLSCSSWNGTSFQVPVSVTTSVTGSGISESFSTVGGLVNLSVVRWREVGQDD